MTKRAFLFLGVVALPMSLASMSTALGFESSKLVPGVVVNGSGFESPKLTPGVVVQGSGLQSSKLSSGVVIQGSGFQSAKLSVGIVVQIVSNAGVVPRAPLVHW